MRNFTCSNCENVVFFENVRCTHCGYTLAYFPDHGLVTAIEAIAGSRQRYRSLSPQIAGEYRLCANSAAYGVCNSAVAAVDDEPLCQACRLNDVIPDLSDASALEAWQSLERCKRRLLFCLRELQLPLESRKQENGLMFSFRRDSPDGKHKVFTGHSDGLITINIAEADDPFREKLRKQLGEGYRTVLGHFRHEIGHYYWDRLIKDSPWLAAYRRLFGDERADYAQAVQRHYASGAPAGWPQQYVSAYATMHPWEDWAETWAHYLHIVDTLDTARSYGLSLRPQAAGRHTREISMSARALDFEDFDALLAGWVPVTIALNSLNRSMGLIDPYPFVLCAKVIEKLRFVHDVVRHWAESEETRSTLARSWLERPLASSILLRRAWQSGRPLRLIAAAPRREPIAPCHTPAARRGRARRPLRASGRRVMSA
ncbi:MAG TPA: putative zinc-binding metallopeptidase [Polyangiales bacterium]|nr:putative zinc-binding metallopeptidase [Polyangiales bacterium]